MATFRDIKIALRSDCVTALDGRIPTERILYESPEERDIVYPRVTYSAYDVPVRYNRGSKPQPYTTLTDSNGDPVTHVYAMFYDFHADVLVEGEPQDSDDSYEALRDHWLPYEHWRDDSDLHADVTDITVGSGDEPTNTDTEPSVFTSMLQLTIEYRKDVTHDGTPIEEIHHNIDADLDGSTDVTYTTDESNS